MKTPGFAAAAFRLWRVLTTALAHARPPRLPNPRENARPHTCPQHGTPMPPGRPRQPRQPRTPAPALHPATQKKCANPGTTTGMPNRTKTGGTPQNRTETTLHAHQIPKTYRNTIRYPSALKSPQIANPASGNTTPDNSTGSTQKCGMIAVIANNLLLIIRRLAQNNGNKTQKCSHTSKKSCLKSAVPQPIRQGLCGYRMAGHTDTPPADHTTPPPSDLPPDDDRGHTQRQPSLPPTGFTRAPMCQNLTHPPLQQTSPTIISKGRQNGRLTSN